MQGLLIFVTEEERDQPTLPPPQLKLFPVEVRGFRWASSELAAAPVLLQTAWFHVKRVDSQSLVSQPPRGLFRVFEDPHSQSSTLSISSRAFKEMHDMRV